MVTVNYLKLKSDTGKVRRTASSVGFICKSLFISYSTSIVYFGKKKKYKIRLIHVLFYFHKISDVLPFTKGIIKLL